MKIDIKNLLERKPRFRKGGFHTNPNIAWEMILALLLVLLIASFAFGAFLFLETNREFKTPLSDAPLGEASVQAKRLENALKIFAERDQSSREILALPSSVVDPSR